MDEARIEDLVEECRSACDKRKSVTYRYVIDPEIQELTDGNYRWFEEFVEDILSNYPCVEREYPHFENDGSITFKLCYLGISELDDIDEMDEATLQHMIAKLYPDEFITPIVLDNNGEGVRENSVTFTLVK